MKLILMLVVLLGISGCGGGRYARSIRHENQTSIKWKAGNVIEVTNRTSKDIADVQIEARFYQAEVLAHTMGYAQWHTPAGWYTTMVSVPRIGPWSSVRKTLTYNIGPNSVRMR